MKLNLVAIGKKMPIWVVNAFNDYAARLPKDFSLQLIEVAAIKRPKNADTQKIKQLESQTLLKAAPSNTALIALDRTGKSLSSQQLAQQLQHYYENRQNLSLLIGGPEGIEPQSLERCDQIWSLSKLTLAHPMVRVIVAEQIYRAWSILHKHPYHR